MAFKDFLKKFIPIGRIEAREQYTELHQLLTETQQLMAVIRQQSAENREQLISMEAQLARTEHQAENTRDQLTHMTDRLIHTEDRLVHLEDRLSHIKDHLQHQDDRMAHMHDLLCDTPASQQELLALCRQMQQERDRLSDRLAGCEAALTRANEMLDETVHGDIFRRIEFIQRKSVVMEGMLQESLLTEKDQTSGIMYRFIERMRSLFPVMRPDTKYPLVRIGRDNDGGYVMVDDFTDRKIAYSIGIADDVSWDKDMAQRGLDIYMYDHTIEGLPEHHDKFHYFKTGLGTAAESAADPALMTLEEMLRANGHENERGMILKIDIEGAEYNVLAEMDESLLSRFSQISFEFHGVSFPQNEEKIRTALQKLNRTHQLVHLHPNNYGSYVMAGHKILPELIEATYLLKEEYHFTKEPLCFPNEYDMINCVYLPDIILGTWDT